MSEIGDVRDQEEQTMEGHEVGEGIEAKPDGSEYDLSDTGPEWDEAVDKLVELDGVEEVGWGETDEGEAFVSIYLADGGSVTITAVPNVVQEDSDEPVGAGIDMEFDPDDTPGPGEHTSEDDGEAAQ